MLEEEDTQPARNSLSALAVHNKQRPVAAPASSGLKRKAFAAADKENAAGLDIFVDEEFQPGKAGAKPSQAAPITGLWTKFGTFEHNRQAQMQ